ncbi:MAG: DUF4215 domain-containing protein, partial [Myxococcota bacterium]|nr:DUF4215 domain-containing protein [Myxococcota bacterium]
MQLLIVVGLLSGIGCVEALAPIDLGSISCDSDTDCSNGLFCLGDEGEKRCLRSSAPRCGDAVINDADACDDGNRVDEDACTNACRLAVCGDRVLRQDLNDGETSYEACDDGNNDDSDTCTSGCQIARCGDGLVWAGGAEACDDGNQNLFDSCTGNCALAVCGDGFRRRDLPNDDAAFENCDDGNLEPGDGCSERCQVEACGNNNLDHGESCDDGNNTDDDACRNNCQLARCGDAVVRRDLPAQSAGFEYCDDGNEGDDDLCSSSCLWDFDLVELPIQTHHNYAIGSLLDEEGRDLNEPRHNVQFSRRFALGRTEVTQEQYAA